MSEEVSYGMMQLQHNQGTEQEPKEHSFLKFQVTHIFSPSILIHSSLFKVWILKGAEAWVFKECWNFLWSSISSSSFGYLREHCIEDL